MALRAVHKHSQAPRLPQERCSDYLLADFNGVDETFSIKGLLKKTVVLPRGALVEALVVHPAHLGTVISCEAK